MNRASSRRRAKSDRDEKDQTRVGAELGTWYEYSKAAKVLGINEAALKKQIKLDARRYKQDRNTKADTPYCKFTFVYVAEEGREAEKDLSIRLSQWITLCKALSNETKLSSDAKELLRLYTGTDQVQGRDEIDASDRFIMPCVLERMLKDRNSKSSISSKSLAESRNTNGQVGEAEASSAAASTSTENSRMQSNPDHNGGGGNIGNTGTGDGGAAHSVIICIGLNNTRVTTYAVRDTNYCRQHWTEFHSKWRSNECIFKPKDGSMEGWRHMIDAGGWQCGKCKNANGNITRKRHPVLFLDSTPSAPSSVLPNTNDIQLDVVKCYRQRRTNMNEFLANGTVKESLLLLRERGVPGVEVGDGNKVFLCPGNAAVTSPCDTVTTARIQSNNTGLCDRCRSKKNQGNRLDRRRDERHDQRVAPGSHCPVSSLTTKELQERTRNFNLARKAREAKIKRLKQRLEDAVKQEIDISGEEDEPSEAHEAFKKESLDIMSKSVGERREDFRNNVSNVLLELLKGGVASESSDVDNEFSEDDVKELVDFLTLEMQNTVMKLSGKDSQVRYSPVMYQLAYAEFSRSKAGFREKREMSPLSMPHERELSGMRSLAKVEDGKCAKVYEMRLCIKRAQGSIEEDGILMVDELKLKHGMLWNTSSHSVSGMANDDLDMKKILKGILTGDNDEPKAAEYVNQWRHKNLVTNEAWNCSYFYNDGSLSGETLLRQFDLVVLSCEAIHSRVLGCVLDAGGNNARLVLICRDGVKLGNDPWLPSEMFFTDNVAEPRRRLYLYFCITHVLKAMRNQLLASSPSNGAKAFEDENDISFGWPMFQEILEELESSWEKDVPRPCRIDERVVNPTKYSKMSVSDAKKVFEYDTLAYIEKRICSALEVEAQDLDKDVCTDSLPFKTMRAEGKHNHTLKHGCHFSRANYLMDLALKRCQAGKSGGDTARDASAAHSTEEPRSTTFDNCKESSSSLIPPIPIPTNNLGASQSADTAHDIITLVATDLEVVLGSAGRRQAGASKPPKVPSSKILSDIATYRYVAAVSAIFNYLLLDAGKTGERFTGDNIETYALFLEEAMSYFGDWKQAQLRRKSNGCRGWNKSFLAKETCTNVRTAVCGYTHFSEYALHHVRVPDCHDGPFIIPMMFGNQTSLEGYFSKTRGSGHDNGAFYGTGVTNNSAKQMQAAARRSSYDPSDNGDEVCENISGMTRFKKFLKAQDEAFAKWKKSCSLRESSTGNISRFGSTPFVPCNSNTGAQCNRMSRPLMPKRYASTISEMSSFQYWMRLSIGLETEDWFYKFAKVSDNELDPVCQRIQQKLFAFMEEFLSQNARHHSSFEWRVRKYIVSDEFRRLYESELPLSIRGHRAGAIYLVKCCAELHEQWFADALREIIPQSHRPEEPDLKLSPENMNYIIHRFVGAAIRVGFKKLRKPTAEHKYGVITAEHGAGILEDARINHSQAVMDPDYMKNFYDSSTQHRNQGGLSLLRKELFPWAKVLVTNVWSTLTDSVIKKQRRDAIKAAYTKLQSCNDIQRKLILAYRSLERLEEDASGSETPDEALIGVCKMILDYVFHAYTGWKWKTKFSAARAKSGDKSNVAHRTQLQCSSGSGSSTGTKRKRPTRPPTATELAELRSAAPEALKKLQNGNNDTKNLQKKECSALLYICYDDFKIIGSHTLSDLKQYLSSAIGSDPTKLNRSESSCVQGAVLAANVDERGNEMEVSTDELGRQTTSDRFDCGAAFASAAARRVSVAGADLPPTGQIMRQSCGSEDHSVEGSDSSAEADKYLENDTDFGEALARIEIPAKRSKESE